MGWDQSYVIPSKLELFEKVLGVTAQELLLKEMDKRGFKIEEEEQITLTEDLYQDILGYKIKLSNGKTYIPKLSVTQSWNGNEGLDTYEWYEESEKPKLKIFQDNEEITGKEEK